MRHVRDLVRRRGCMRRIAIRPGAVPPHRLLRRPGGRRVPLRGLQSVHAERRILSHVRWHPRRLLRGGVQRNLLRPHERSAELRRVRFRLPFRPDVCEWRLLRYEARLRPRSRRRVLQSRRGDVVSLLLGGWVHGHELGSAELRGVRERVRLGGDVQRRGVRVSLGARGDRRVTSHRDDPARFSRRCPYRPRRLTAQGGLRSYWLRDQQARARWSGA